MSKKGRGRRTPEERNAAKDRRSSLAYIQRIQREVAADTQAQVSETEDEANSK